MTVGLSTKAVFRIFGGYVRHDDSYSVVRTMYFSILNGRLCL